MGLPFPVFNIPIISNLIELVNNVLETNTVKSTRKMVSDKTRPYLMWILTKFNFYILYIVKLFNTVPVRLTKDLYYIEYFHEGKTYRIVFPIKSYNDINIVKVNSLFNDSVEIIKYLGPCRLIIAIPVLPGVV